MVVTHEAAFRLLYGRDDADDHELGDALRRVEDAIAEAIDPLIDAGLEPEHRRFLAYAVVGMAEGASRQWLAGRHAGARDDGRPTARPRRPSGWPPGWPTWPGPGCARSTPTDDPAGPGPSTSEAGARVSRGPVRATQSSAGAGRVDVVLAPAGSATSSSSPRVDRGQFQRGHPLGQRTRGRGQVAAEPADGGRAVGGGGVDRRT